MVFHFPRYFDGFRSRSRRSASNSFRMIRARLCLRAIVTDWGNIQACLARAASVSHINLKKFIKRMFQSSPQCLLALVAVKSWCGSEQSEEFQDDDHYHDGTDDIDY